ncbi:beta-1,4-N-acetylgalactosaminyltransferase 3 isoform X2 [Gouania willdenowi]|uniref:beta-1,4-N-acetylgalactosaminyltransferase 3 isoform X2 n=1 Tax=Gouania willdenowi TaxID=441366 RepID=UPI00105440C9|nr:beta-1,4-N-acetylgalactosaminyltransferase 3-like isoform X2 [Gouania willdenowi]
MSGFNSDSSGWKIMYDERIRKAKHPVKESAAWTSKLTPQTWKPEYKGRANLHVFEDWCGRSIADLRRNQHYPLYPHIRTTVSKLAVSPQWNDYGLRIFGFIHPYTNGEFVFALSSDDNSELWLSTDDSPLNLRLLAWVGNSGSEWTAPGEFEKYSSQSSRPVRLFTERKYFFEVLHKQDDRGTDHVEVAWQLLDEDDRFMIIESKHISLYTDEWSLLMSDVDHIPQTAASHQRGPTAPPSEPSHAPADMLRDDVRDSFFQVPLINSQLLKGVLPDCSYNPSYTIKDFPLTRYQGLQFVHLSYIYPNDYTRLTHMETDNTCFYPENPSFMKKYGFSRYMRLDGLDPLETNYENRDYDFEKRNFLPDDDDFNDSYKNKKEEQGNVMKNAAHRNYGDDFDDYALQRRRRIFSLVVRDDEQKKSNFSSERKVRVAKSRRKKKSHHVLEPGKNLSREAVKPEVPEKGSEQINTPGKLSKSSKRLRLKSAERKRQIAPTQVARKEQHKVKGGNSHNLNHTHILHYQTHAVVPTPGKSTVSNLRRFINREKELRYFTTQQERIQRDTNARKDLLNKEAELNKPLQQHHENAIHKANVVDEKMIGRGWSDREREENQIGEEYEEGRRDVKVEDDSPWLLFNGVDDDDELTPTPAFDAPVNWNQTFVISTTDLQATRSDWIDLKCNVSGNLLLHSSDALSVVKSFMQQLNRKHNRRFILLRVVNVEKRVDGFQGNRYLLELELKDTMGGQVLRVSHYVYALLRSREWKSDFLSDPHFVLCNPLGFQWNPIATVHFIVPVKNQARWVQQMIIDMEQLFEVSGDQHFNLIITDYNSTDMDVRKALQKSSLHRYQYVKLGGNFERSAGLQAGIDLIHDKHSIVFLCDLHINFPPSIIDTIRRHCVEGHMAFAPIVLRLNCGATPSEAKGYWEVNGFGLLGIYKSDLLAAGGMNTKDFKDRWGGEDWELLDRLLQSGLEVERIYMRNFFHHHHSKRGMWNRKTSPSRG